MPGALAPASLTRPEIPATIAPVPSPPGQRRNSANPNGAPRPAWRRRRAGFRRAARNLSSRREWRERWRLAQVPQGHGRHPNRAARFVGRPPPTSPRPHALHLLDLVAGRTFPLAPRPAWGNRGSAPFVPQDASRTSIRSSGGRRRRTEGDGEGRRTSSRIRPSPKGFHTAPSLLLN